MAAYVCFAPEENLGAALPTGVVYGIGQRSVENQPWELCAMTERGAELLDTAVMRCTTLLVPEGVYRPQWYASQVVSYGMSGRSSLTLSSTERTGLLCVQRTLWDRMGRLVEGQELALPDTLSSYAPQERLLLGAVWLLWTGSIG